MKRLLYATVFVILAAGAARADVIDRILAVVGSSIVTQSDVFAAMRLGLETPPPRATDPIGAVLDRIIERRLMLAEVERYAPPEPPDVEVELRAQQVRLSFPSTAAFRRALVETGQSEEDLLRYLRDELRIAAYLRQRFGMASRVPSEQEVFDYYNTHRARFTRDGVVRPFDEAHAEARAAVIAELREKDISEWLAGLRRRGSVSLLYAGR